MADEFDKYYEKLIEEGKGLTPEESFNKAVEKGIIHKGTTREDFLKAFQYVDKTGRDINPEAYALTLNEARYIERAYLTQHSVLRSFLSLDEAEFADPAKQAYIQEQVDKALAKRHITRKRINAIAEAVLYEGRYWSFDIGNLIIPAGKQYPVAQEYVVVSNTEGIDGIRFSEDTCPAFFDSWDAAEEAAALGIPDTVKYIPSSELFILRQVYGAHLEKLTKPQAQEKNFFRIPNNPAINALVNMGSQSLMEKTLLENFGKSNYEIKVNGGVSVYIPQDQIDDIIIGNVDTDKLLRQAINASYQSGYRSKEVILSLSDIMEAQGKKDRKTAAATLRSSLKRLEAISITYNNQITGSFSKRRIVQSVDYDAGRGRQAIARIVFTDAYYNMLKDTTAAGMIAAYPDKILKISAKNKHSYIFALQFFTNMRRNLGKKNECRLSVQSLLNSSGLPLYDSLKDKSQVAQRIITPFDEALSLLEKEHILSYEYRYPGGGVLTHEDLEKLYTNYETFSSLMVWAYFYDEPDYTTIRKSRELNGKTAAKKKRGRPLKNKPQDEQPIE